VDDVEEATVSVVVAGAVLVTEEEVVTDATPDLSENFSNFAIICLPYVYLRKEFMCGRILCNNVFRCVGSETSIIF
jgi:hypothetical protein